MVSTRLITWTAGTIMCCGITLMFYHFLLRPISASLNISPQLQVVISAVFLGVSATIWVLMSGSEDEMVKMSDEIIHERTHKDDKKMLEYNAFLQYMDISRKFNNMSSDNEDKLIALYNELSDLMQTLPQDKLEDAKVLQENMQKRISLMRKTFKGKETNSAN
ncbi:hypothetical protein D6745_03590 [Candidatus Woesearchaeota archaeon]|nr:MAG: hypothetical protein D6745_03590 [Candidatus Woesearchaeota archaeon]